MNKFSFIKLHKLNRVHWMKQFWAIFTFLLLGCSLSSLATNKTITGAVLDYNSQPVVNQPMVIYYDSTAQPGTYSQITVYTDSQGEYSGTVQAALATGNIYVYTSDCQSNLIQNQVNYNAASTYNNIDFVYCNFSSNLTAEIIPDSSGTPYILTANSINAFGPVAYQWSTGATTDTIHVTHNGFYCVTITDNSNSQASTCRQVYLNCSARFSHSMVGTEANFTGIAEGYLPIQFQWSYGDGSSDSGISTSHLYSATSITPFETCVTITDAANCSASYCDNVIVGPNGGDFSITGNLSASIHNLTSANVYLLSEQADTADRVFNVIDSVTITGTNNYAFHHLPIGEYLVRAEALPNSSHFNDFAATYFGGFIGWQYATSLFLQSNSTNNNIMLRSINHPMGAGSISGTITDSSSLWGIEGIAVYAVDQNNVIRGRSITNTSGEYLITSLMEGEYELFVDFPGKFAEPYPFTISSSQLNVTDKNWEARFRFVAPPDPTVSIQEVASTAVNKFTVFPNPARETVQIVNNTQDAIRSAEIYSLHGQLIDSNVSLTNHLTLSINHLPSGVYSLIVKTEQGNTFTQPLIIQ